MGADKERTVECPNCKKPARMENSNPYRPFCGKRCKLIDLGEWASEGYKIPTVEKPFPEENND